MRDLALILSRISVIALAIASLTACGGGGGGGSEPATNNSNQGSLAIAEVDADHDGLVEISTLEQLDWIRNDPAGKSLRDSSQRTNSKGCPASGCFGYELVADLNFDTNGDGIMDARDTYFDYDKDGTSAGWRPILAFAGAFEGNGHRISNLYINRPGTDGNGLFGSIYNATTPVFFRNLRLDGSLTSVTGRSDVGIFAGSISVATPTELKNLNISGTATAKGFVAGGAIGTLNVRADLSLADNVVNATVKASAGATGGLIGATNFYVGGVTASITGNTSNSSVTGEMAGGLLGYLAPTNGTAIIERNTSTGVVDGSRFSGGGLIGDLYDSSNAANIIVRGSHSSSKVSSAGVAGGLIASAAGGNTLIENAFATGQVTGSYPGAGGLIGGLSCGRETTLRQSYATGVVSTAFTVSNPGGITGSPAGGLIATVNGNSSGSCSIVSNFATGNVDSGPTSGALIGTIENPSPSTSAITVTNNFASGSATAVATTGGVIGKVWLLSNAALTLTRNLAVGQLTVDPTWLPANTPGGVIGTVWVDPGVTYTVGYNYWASDTTTAANSMYTTPLGFTPLGIVVASRAQLECPLTANNFSCASGELYHNWNTSTDANGNALWNFGTTAQLPGLRIGNEIHRPVFDGTKYQVVRETL